MERNLPFCERESLWLVYIGRKRRNFQICSQRIQYNIDIEMKRVKDKFAFAFAQSPFTLRVCVKLYIIRVPTRPGKPGKMRVHLENLEISWNFEKINKYHGKMT